MGNLAIFEKILEHAGRREPAAICILVRAEGSVPQKAGAKMLVRADRTIEGTIGGGRLEAEVITTALKALDGQGCQTLDLRLTEEYGYACGGRVLVYIEPIVSEPHLVIFGAGHVGRALCRLGRFAGFQVTVGDDRPECANEECLPDASRTVILDWDHALSHISVDDNTYIVVATRGHSHDFQVVAQALKTPARYIGLVGSKKKSAMLVRFLEEQGMAQDAVNRVITPVGLPIGSVTPEEIAVSIVAQLIEHRRVHEPTSVGHSACSGSLS
jgi:xanthine dehydrogenase accessory factor